MSRHEIALLIPGAVALVLFAWLALIWVFTR